MHVGLQVCYYTGLYVNIMYCVHVCVNDYRLILYMRVCVCVCVCARACLLCVQFIIMRLGYIYACNVTDIQTILSV